MDFNEIKKMMIESTKHLYNDIDLSTLSAEELEILQTQREIYKGIHGYEDVNFIQELEPSVKSDPFISEESSVLSIMNNHNIEEYTKEEIINQELTKLDMKKNFLEVELEMLQEEMDITTDNARKQELSIQYTTKANELEDILEVINQYSTWEKG